MSPHSYSIYGLQLEADYPVPGLVAARPRSQADVRLRLGSMPSWMNEKLDSAEAFYESARLDDHGRPSLTCSRLDGGAYIRLLYQDGTEFVIDRSGARVWARWPESATVEETSLYLLGPVMGLVLRLRGRACLHASVVKIGDGAIAIAGSSGSGKSTTAAVFARLGFSILSDDVAPLSYEHGRFMIDAGYPRLRLWPESVRSLYGSTDALPLLTPSWGKHYLSLNENGHRFQQEPLPLAAVYLLGERTAAPEAPIIRPVRKQKAVIDLLANAYAGYFLDKAMRAQEFEFITRLADEVAVRLIEPSSDFDRLSEMCGVITDDLAEYV